MKKCSINIKIRTTFFVLISYLLIWEFLFNVKTVKYCLALLVKGVDNYKTQINFQNIDIRIDYLKNGPASFLPNHHIISKKLVSTEFSQINWSCSPSLYEINIHKLKGEKKLNGHMANWCSLCDTVFLIYKSQ